MLTRSALHHDPQAFSLTDPSTSSLQAKPLHSSTFLGLPGSYPASRPGLREESAWGPEMLRLDCFIRAPPASPSSSGAQGGGLHGAHVHRDVLASLTDAWGERTFLVPGWHGVCMFVLVSSEILFPQRETVRGARFEFRRPSFHAGFASHSAWPPAALLGSELSLVGSQSLWSSSSTSVKWEQHQNLYSQGCCEHQLHSMCENTLWSENTLAGVITPNNQNGPAHSVLTLTPLFMTHVSLKQET